MYIPSIYMYSRVWKSKGLTDIEEYVWVNTRLELIELVLALKACSKDACILGALPISTSRPYM